MCRRLVSILVLIASVIVLAALPSAGAPSANDASIASSEATAPTELVAPSTPIQVTLDIDRAPALGEVANVTASVTSVLPAPGTTLQIEVPAGAEVVSGETAWAGDLEEGEQVDLSLSLRFVQEGEWTIAATALRPVDADNTWGDVAQVFLTVKSESGQFGLAAPAAGLSHTEEQGEPFFGDVPPPQPAETPVPGAEYEELHSSPVDVDAEEGVSSSADEVSSPSADEASSPGSITVRGHVYYCDRDNVVKPLRYAPVEIWDSETGPDEYLGYDFTDANGYYQFGPYNNDDGWGAGGRDIYTKVPLKTDKRLVESQDFPYYDYSWSSKSCCKQNNVPDGIVNHPSWEVPCSSHNRGAVWIFNTLRDGWAFPPHSIGDPGKVVVRWDRDSTHGNHYHPKWLLGGGHVHLRANAGCSRDTIIHEAAHAYMDNVYSSMPDFHCPSPHDFCSAHHVNCAWGEGWADFLPVAVYQDQHYNWPGTYHLSGGACGVGASINVETPPSYCDDGDAVEGRVAGALLDIFDSHDDGDDHHDGGFYDIWDTFYNQDDSRFRYFWNAWKARGHNKHDVVQAIFQNTIDYDTAPTLSGIPNKSLNEDASWNNAIDPYQYAYDPESSDGQLDYTIIANTAPDCGVSLDSLEYIDINPTADWCGYCDVTLRASDGIKSDTDQFRVTVICINDAPTISGLPAQYVNQDTSLDNTIDLWAYASDPETADQLLTFSKTGDTNPDVGVSIDSNRYIDINPTADWCGQSDVTIRVTDPGGLWDEDTFSVYVNCPPTLSGLPDRSLDQDTSLDNTIDLWAYTSDPESWDILLTFSKTGDTNPNVGVSIGSNRFIDITPTAGWCGWSDVTIRVADPSGLWDEDTFRVTVTCVNQPPTISGLPDQTLPQDTSRDNAIDLWVYASDPESWDILLTFSKTEDTNPNVGVSIDSNRYVDINPTPGWCGQSDVTIRVADPSGLWDEDTFRVTVNCTAPATWSAWQHLGGKLSGQLSAAATASNDVYLFGVNAAGKPYYNHWNGTSWEGWKGLGGRLSSNSLSAVAAGTDVYVFGLGGGGDDRPYYNRLSGGSWTGWQSMGGRLTGQLSAAATASNDVYLFGVNAAGKPYYKHYG